MRTTRTCRTLAAAGAVAMLLGACGGGGKGGESPEPTAAATATGSPAPLAPGAAFQASLDRLRNRTVVLRAARALSAAQFNSTAEAGTDRDVARKLVLAACADLGKAYSEFDAAVVAIDYPAGADGDVDTLITKTRSLVAVLDQYRTAFEGGEFAEINTREVSATADWEKAVTALATKLGASATPKPTPTAAA